MMNRLENAARQALEALKKTHYRIIDAGLLDQQLLNENFTAATNLREALAEQQAAEPVAWCPDVCPITGRPFFMWIEHHKTGQMVPTYGGPYDSYTIPVRDKDGSYCRERYDHDNGWWVTDEIDDVGIQIVSDQAYVSEQHPPTQQPLTDEQAYDMGVKGGAPTEHERLLFEAWMRGHCWKVQGDWDGKTYVHSTEKGAKNVHTGAMHTRCLWAAWRDRAALAAHAITSKEGGAA